jgi:hypothetical protein
MLTGRLHHHHPGHPEAGQTLLATIGSSWRVPGLLHPPQARTRHPHAAHKLGLTDIQCRHSLDDLLFVVLYFHASHLLGSVTKYRRPPVGAVRETANLVLVL